MGWISKPTLPKGSVWSDEKTDSWTSNWIKIDLTVKTARGAGDTYYVWIHGRFSHGDNNTFFNSTLYPFVGDDEKQKFTTGATDGGTKDLYYSASSSSSGSISVGISSGSETHTTNNGTKVNAVIPPKLTYLVQYNGNGNTGGSTASQAKVSGTALTLRSNGFTKTGYDFVKWNTAADGSGTSYNAGASYTANDHVTLYAQWVKANIPVYTAAGNQVRQVEKAYTAVNNQIKEVTVYTAVNGQIKTLV